MLEGSASILIDTGTGLIMSLRTIQSIQTHRSGYVSDTRYELKRVSYGTPADPSLFKLPSTDIREVKELSHWTAAKIKNS